MTEAEKERAAVVAWLEEMAEDASKKPQPSDWPKGAWLARQVALVNHLGCAAQAIQRGDHMK